MRYKVQADLHVHTDHSPDGAHSATLLCERALEAGLRVLAITDHCECNAYHADRYDLRLRQSVLDANKCKSVFAGRLLVLAGVELGQPLQDPAAARDALRHRPDFVLASCHNLPGREDFYDLDYRLPENEPRALFAAYLEQLRALVDWGAFDALAHLTYPIRYFPCDKGPFDLAPFRDQITALLTELAAKGRALEINTGGADTVGLIPNKAIISQFRRLGGRYVTIGSDAHRCDRVGSGLQAGLHAAREAGFDAITFFQNRTPIQIPIETISEEAI